MLKEILSVVSSFLSDTVIYIAIGLVTFIGVIKCIYPVLRNSALLNRAVVKLEKTVAAGKRAVWRESRFLGRSLRADWQRFLMNAGQLDARGMPCDVGEFINEETVIEKPGHTQLAELIPSLLTSLGILGTFIGLMTGLSSINFADAEGTIQSIPLLLSGMKFAFATSVAGIACSLLFNVFFRMSVGRAYRALDAFDEAFYELAMPRPLTSDVQMLCLNQDEDVRMMRVADTVGSKVAASFEAALARAMVPMSQSMDSFLRGATQEQVEGVRRIVGQFVQQLNTSLSGELTNLGHTINMVSESQQQSQENLQVTLDAAQAMAENARQMQEASSEIARKMTDWVDEMQSGSEERIRTLGGVEQQSQLLAQQLEALTASLARMQVKVDQLCDEMDQAQE